MVQASRVAKIIAGAVIGLSLIFSVNLTAATNFAYAGAQTSAKTAVAQSAKTTNAQSATTAQKADKLIAFAESLIGKVHYRYGANDPRHLIFDCSSFTKYVYSTLGINLKWGAGKQATQGTHVAKADLKKGDLVHFSVGTPGKIGHVGIYIGNGKFIHNLKPGSNVLISDLNSNYWRNHYITATRILK